MAVVTQVLEAFGLLGSPATRRANASAHLVLSWPASTTPVRAGAVVSPSGALGRGASPTARVVAFVAPETTLRGLGETVFTWLSTIPAPQVPVPVALDVTRALLAYNAEELDLTTVVGVVNGTIVGPRRIFPAWEVGHGIRLPIELQNGVPTTDLAVWTRLAATSKADHSAWDALLDLLPEALELPDHDADAVASAGVVTAHPVLAEAAPDLREALLTNPFRALYSTLALLTAADDVGGASDLVTALVLDALDADELSLLAASRSGASVLRALYRRLAAAAAAGGAGNPARVDQAVAALNMSLGIVGASPVDLAVTTPSVVPVELPTSPGWLTRPDVPGKTPAPTDTNGERRDGRHDLVHGRDFYAGRLYTIGSYRGPAYRGNPELEAAQFVHDHRLEVTAGADPRTLARLAVVEAVAPNEGYLDSVRLLDRAILSIGVQQWTVHVDDELDVLLWQLSVEHPDDFDTHFGIHGLRLQISATWPAGTRGMASGSPRRVVQQQAVPGGANLDMPAAGTAPVPPAVRLQFFGGAPDPTHPGQYRFDHTAWAGRIRSAVRCSRPLQLLQIQAAVRRFDRILAEGRTWTVGGQPRTIDQLVTSAQGAAQLLDQHINVPGHVGDDIASAIAHTTTLPIADAGGLTNSWLSAFESRYLVAVRYGPQSSGVYKTDVFGSNNKLLHRGRQSYILSLGLSTVPHSFDGGW